LLAPGSLSGRGKQTAKKNRPVLSCIFLLGHLDLEKKNGPLKKGKHTAQKKQRKRFNKTFIFLIFI
jgi:hypothetical protein